MGRGVDVDVPRPASTVIAGRRASSPVTVCHGDLPRGRCAAPATCARCRRCHRYGAAGGGAEVRREGDRERQAGSEREADRCSTAAAYFRQAPSAPANIVNPGTVLARSAQPGQSHVDRAAPHDSVQAAGRPTWRSSQACRGGRRSGATAAPDSMILTRRVQRRGIVSVGAARKIGDVQRAQIGAGRPALLGRHGPVDVVANRSGCPATGPATTAALCGRRSRSSAGSPPETAWNWTPRWPSRPGPGRRRRSRRRGRHRSPRRAAISVAAAAQDFIVAREHGVDVGGALCRCLRATPGRGTPGGRAVYRRRATGSGCRARGLDGLLHRLLRSR